MKKKHVNDPSSISVYDEGGDLPVVSPDRMQQMSSLVPTEQAKGPSFKNKLLSGLAGAATNTDTQPQEEEAPITPYHGRLQWAIPTYDKGGKVMPRIDLNDGEHQLIVAKAGERVLTPEQNKEYERSHKNARREPMRVPSNKVSGMPVIPVYDEGGDVEYGVPSVDIGFKRRTASTEPEGRPEFVNWNALERAGRARIQRAVNEGLGKIDIKPVKLFDDGGVVDEKDLPAVSDERKGALGRIEIPEDDSQLKPLPYSEGAPVDFGGPVYPNRAGARVQADTDQPLIRDENTAKMDNSLANGPIMDTGLANQTELIPVSTGVRGFGEGAPVQRSTMPDQLPTISPEREQIDRDKLEAAKKGPAGLIDLGTANIHERELDKHEAGLPRIADVAPSPAAPELIAPAAVPKYSGPGKPVPVGEAIPEKQLAKDTYEYKKAELDKRIEAARNAAVDEKSSPEDRAAAQTLADRLELRREELKKPAPTSVLGRIGRGFEVAGNIAGDVFAPGTMALIPGTQLHRSMERAGTLGRIKEDIGAEKELAEAKSKDTSDRYREIPGGAVNPATGRVEPAFFNPADISEPIHFGGVAVAPKGAEAASLGSEGVANANSAFADRYQILHPGASLPKQYTLPPNATKADFDRVDKQMEQVEKAEGTKAQQDQTREMQRQAREEAKRRWEETQGQKLVNYRDKDGNLVSGTREEAQDAGGKISGPTTSAEQQKARSAYTQYHRLQDNAEVAMSTLPAWQNETNRKAAMDVSKMYWDSAHASVGILGAAISSDHMQILLNSDAYRKMDKQGQEHMQNMMQLWSDAINLAKLETGSSRAVQAAIEKEERIMPSADKTPEQNIKALEDLYKRLNTDSKEYARPSDIDPLRIGLVPYNATHELQDKQGRVVGYVGADGKDHLFGK